MKKVEKMKLQVAGLSTAVIAAIVTTSPAMAALDAAIATGITEVQTDGLAIQGLIWPAVIAITGGFVVMKLFKRGASKI